MLVRDKTTTTKNAVLPLATITLPFKKDHLYTREPANNSYTQRKCAQLAGNKYSTFSVKLLLCDLDECLWRPIEEQQLTEEFFFHFQFTKLAYQIDVKAELEQEIR